MAQAQGTKPSILFISQLNEDLPQFQELQQYFNVLHYKLTTKDELIDKLQTEFSSISGIYGGWPGFMSIGGLTADLVEVLPASVKMIAIASVGYDSYDVDALKARGIKLFNSPSLGAEHVADTVLYHTLNLFRHYYINESYSRQYRHTIRARYELHAEEFDVGTGQLGKSKPTEFYKAFPFGHIIGGLRSESPFGKKCGILGFGQIGQAVGRRLSAIGMEVYYNKRNRLSAEQENQLGYKAKFLEFTQLLQAADLIVLCLPGNAQTFHLINRETIKLFKKSGVLLVNVGRGSIINDEDLMEGVRAGVIKGFGTDVYSREPVINDEFIRDDFSLTPHIGSSTTDVFDATGIIAINNFIDVLVRGEDGTSRIC